METGKLMDMVDVPSASAAGQPGSIEWREWCWQQPDGVSTVAIYTLLEAVNDAAVRKF